MGEGATALLGVPDMTPRTLEAFSLGFVETAK